MTKPAKKQKRIWVTDEVTRKLVLEFRTTNVSVLNALKFATYSDMAKAIRVRADQLMDDVIKSNKQLMEEFHV